MKLMRIRSSLCCEAPQPDNWSANHGSTWQHDGETTAIRCDCADADRHAARSRQPRRLSRNTACSPNRFQNHHGALKPQRRAPGIERDGAFHLGADDVAELAEVLDGAEMDVGRVVPGIGQVVGARHAAAEAELQRGCASGRNSGTTRRRAGRCAACARAPRAAGASPAGSATGSRSRTRRRDSRRGRCRRRPGSPRGPWRRIR